MKRILAMLMAGALIGLAGCADSSTGSSDPAGSVSEASSSEPSSSETDETPVEVPPFSGFDPGADMSDEELAAAIKAAYEGTGEFSTDKLPTATIETSMGVIKIRLFPQFAPKTVENFVTHAMEGYYDNTKFHRVINDFMIQGGDPKGNGTGGESIWESPFEDEFSDILHNFRGALSMANSGSNSNGSQFFIVQNKTPIAAETWGGYLPSIYMQRQLYEAYARLLPMTQGKTNEEIQENSAIQKAMETLNAELAAKGGEGLPEAYAARLAPAGEIYAQVGGTPHLDNKHTVFGYVYEGMDVVDAIAGVEMKGTESPDSETPKDNVMVKSITITDPEGVLPQSSPGEASQDSPQEAPSSEAPAGSSEEASENASSAS